MSPVVQAVQLQVDMGEVLADRKMALQHVLSATPGWSEEAAKAATVDQISGALTNLVYRCASPLASRNATVIVRVFGSGGRLFSQKDERDIFLLASELRLGPKCLVEYRNGRVEEFLPGDTLTTQKMRDPAISAGIAAAMAEFHVRMLGSPPSGAQQLAGVAATSEALQPAIYGRIREWYGAVQEVCSEEELAAVGLRDLLAELDALEAHLGAQFPAWVGFCHNDLQYGNMLVQYSSPAAASEPSGAPAAECATAPSQPPPAGVASPSGACTAGGPTIKLIDYEYSTLNDVGFDVANHFCEWAFNYHSDEAHVFHDGWLPTQEQQLHFCRAYIAAMQQQLGGAQRIGSLPAEQLDKKAGCPQVSSPPSVTDPTHLPSRILAANGCLGQAGSMDSSMDSSEAAAGLLLRKAQANLPLSHLKWGLWGLIQDKLSDVEFDYLGYAKQRLERYHTTKPAELAAAATPHGQQRVQGTAHLMPV